MTAPATITLALLAACTAATSPLGAEPVRFTVDPTREIGPISPWIYGSNHDVDAHRIDTARRLGGNRLSTFNWETGASNAGRDYTHSSDLWLVAEQPLDWWGINHTEPEPDATPGAVLTTFHDESLARGSMSLIQVPMLGLVAADAHGPVAEHEAAPSPRWAPARATPAQDNVNTNTVSALEMIQWLVNQYGPADAHQGVRAYGLGNEPGLWHETHPRARATPITCRELLDTSIEFASAIKRADPSAEVYGPALWGFGSMNNLHGAADWPALHREHAYDWFVDAYLDTMRLHSERAGTRLLDAFDIHWYPQPTAPEARETAAMAGPRSLYDESYTEPTWIGEHFPRFLPILPRLQQSIERYFPGTKIVIGEYDWDLGGTIAGGLAQADALGAFGRHGVHAAFYHHFTHNRPDAFIGAAFELYRSTDTTTPHFGDIALEITPPITSNGNISAYSSKSSTHDTLHIIVVDRRPTGTDIEIEIAAHHVGTPDGVSIDAWILDAAAPAVRHLTPPPTLTDHTITFESPGRAAVHLIIHAQPRRPTDEQEPRRE
ncbi:MAG: glycoside hydrolase family 44 protein [Planctomycetota bacterium]